jgi:hypothetical protein
MRNGRLEWLNAALPTSNLQLPNIWVEFKAGVVSSKEFGSWVLEVGN